MYRHFKGGKEMYSQLRPVDLGNGRNSNASTEDHHEHNHSHVDPNKALVDYINGVARDLDAYNHKVAKITHQEDKL